MVSSDASPVESKVSTLLNNLREGVTIFSVTPNTVEPLHLTQALPPLLTCDGTSQHLASVLDCFVRWDGDVKIAALQDEGLLDVWVI